MASPRKVRDYSTWTWNGADININRVPTPSGTSELVLTLVLSINGEVQDAALSILGNK
jgi:hypothetical protein